MVLIACVLALVVVEAGFAAQARAADQAQVTLDNNGDGTKTLHYEPLDNRANDVTVKFNNHDTTPATPVDESGPTDDTYDVADASIHNPAGDCTKGVGVGTWACPVANVTKIVINTGGGGDTVDLCQAAALGTPCPAHIGIDAVVDGGGAGDELTSAGDSDPSSSHGTTVLIGGQGADTLNAAAGSITFVSYNESFRTHGVSVTLPSTVDVPVIDQGQAGENDTLAGFISGVIGSPDDDYLVGNLMSNTFIGGPGNDTMIGLAGRDTVSYEDHSAAVNAYADTPAVLTTDGSGPILHVGTGSASGAIGENDQIGDDIEDLVGGSGNDTLVGTHRDDSWSGEFDGGPGNDSLDGGPGPDVLEGGDGFDTVTYAADLNRADPVHVTVGANADDGSTYDQVNPAFPGPRDTVEDDVERVVGTSGDDALNGSAKADTLEGGNGVDDIDGGGGNDTLSGGDGSDKIKGAAGDDTVNGDNGGDTLAGGDGTDTINGGEGDDSLDGGEGGDALNGGNGSDIADYSSRLAAVAVSADGSPGDGETGENDNVATDVESITGGSGNDSLAGNSDGGTFKGGPGTDGIDGGGGPDILMGGTGFDTADYSARSGAVSVDLSSPSGDGEAGEGDDVQGDIERVVGGSAGDSLTGGPSADAIEGGGGNDVIAGAAGQDKIDGGGGNDTIDGGADNDALGGGEGKDAIAGGEGNDAIGGEGGEDTLSGQGGSDSFSGGGGSDTVSYAGIGAALTITFDGLGNDGMPDEGDNLQGDVESLVSGSGNDKIDSSGDGNNGRIDCAGGNDSLIADAGDTAVGCEDVSGSGSPTVSISSSSAKMSKTGTVAIKISCPASPSNCAGTLTLKSSAKASSAKRKSLGKLGSTRFSLAASHTKSVTIKLSSAAKRTIKHKGKLRATATAVASGLGTATKPITITAPKGNQR